MNIKKFTKNIAIFGFLLAMQGLVFIYCEVSTHALRAALYNCAVGNKYGLSYHQKYQFFITRRASHDETFSQDHVYSHYSGA